MSPAWQYRGSCWSQETGLEVSQSGTWVREGQVEAVVAQSWNGTQGGDMLKLSCSREEELYQAMMEEHWS